jgi:hypothetical protein
LGDHRPLYSSQRMSLHVTLDWFVGADRIGEGMCEGNQLYKYVEVNHMIC